MSYKLFSGNRDISLAIEDSIPTQAEAIGAARTIVQGEARAGRRNRHGRCPRAITVVGVKGAAKNAKRVTVVALGPKRDRVEVRRAA